MGGRAGGGASGGMGSGSRMSKEERAFWKQVDASQKAWKKDFDARTGQARTPFEKGSAEYKEAQKISNVIFNSGETSWKGYGGSFTSKALAGGDWDMAADRVKFATDFVSKKGNAFEKSVAASVAKTIRPSGKGSKVAFVSQKQAWVLGKAMSEFHVKADDFPF